MENYKSEIASLQHKLDLLLEKQNSFSREIYNLKAEIIALKLKLNSAQNETKVTENALRVKEVVTPIQEKKVASKAITQPKIEEKKKHNKTNSELEKFIGENLINKIGIIITVIGISLGAKYSIDHDLISPLGRILIGYAAGIALLLFGIKLKAKYTSYSAVLVSGAMASLYFITYAAYSYYDLFSVTIAFGLMVIFTVFTVIAALNYNRQVIAVIGLVGAYAVPILLSDGSGRIAIMLSYMAVINLGILAVSIKKEWRPLQVIAFTLSWIVYLAWYVTGFNSNENLALAITFLCLFFLTFYSAILIYKFINNTKFQLNDIILIITNSFIFYAVGYSLCSTQKGWSDYFGLFTLINAIIHFAIGSVIYKRSLADKTIFYLIFGLVITFITITIPVQLSGNWVTLLWVLEGSVLLYFGQKKEVIFYEKIAYILLVLGIGSLLHDWSISYGAVIYTDKPVAFITVFNIHFLSSLIVVLCLAFSGSSNKIKETIISPKGKILGLLSVVILFFAIGLEIDHYWNMKFANSWVRLDQSKGEVLYKNYEIISFHKIWLVNYGLIFLGLANGINLFVNKNNSVGKALLAISAVMIFLFLSVGLYEISELREAYLFPSKQNVYEVSFYYILIRYISLATVGALIWVIYRKAIPYWLNLKTQIYTELGLHLVFIWLLSSELLHWMDYADTINSYKLVLSILWGLYALGLVAIGIWKHKQHLRLGAMVLFAITLLKLFVYDINHLDTIAKTIIFVILGVLLLIISFLYNKYKNQINNET